LISRHPGLRARAAEASRRASPALRTACCHIPREIADALGLATARMIPPGTVASVSRGEALSGAGACAWCKSGLGSEEADHPWIGAATCDQMRRALELAGRSAGREALIIHAPKTRSPEAEAYFVTEVRWLAGEMEKAAGRRLDREELRRAIALRNGIRGRLRLLREGLTGADFSVLVYLEARLPAGEMNAFLASFRPVPSASAGVPVLLAGGPLTPGDWPWLDELEETGLLVVADTTCTGDRAVDFTVEAPEETDPLESLARGYFRRPPCPFVRPNDEFYAYAADLARRRGARAVIWRSLRGCDIHALEPPRADRLLGLPLLALDVSCGESSSPRVRTRVEAFLEGLR
jgi:benzoyl-CoA reductase/2-hydroxyglutaryl-CoA dehydratase subunit BcrC/BadD/HgdB